MRRQARARDALLTAAALLAAACGDESGPLSAGAAALPTPALARALRRAYDGAPPRIPHESFHVACTACHVEGGVAVPGVGVAPPAPHSADALAGPMQRCQQCHVFSASSELFSESAFEGLPQDLRRGERAYAGAPPRLPHLVQMRENCLACHAGPTARAEIRCTHPERARCLQCHAQVAADGEFARP